MSITQPAPVDVRRFHQLSEGLFDTPAEFIAYYLRITEDRFFQLQSFLRAGNAVEVGRIAHAMAGLNVMVGLNSFVEILQALEAAAEARDLQNANQQFLRCVVAFASIRRQLSTASPH